MSNAMILSNPADADGARGADDAAGRPGEDRVLAVE